MNESTELNAAAATLSMGSLRSIGRGEQLAFIGLPSSKRSAKQLSGSADELLRNIASILDQLLIGAIEKRTAVEFEAARNEAFAKYARVMLALSNLVTIIVPRPVIARLTAESFCEMESEFRDHAVVAFGPEIRDQAIFTIWTLRKISDLSQKIDSAQKVDDSLKEKDSEFANLFSYHALRARFHLDCLTTSMHARRPIYPEVLEVVSDGLRSAVNAYAWIRQGVDLRFNTEEVIIGPIGLDEEDRIFLEASARDMSSETD